MRQRVSAALGAQAALDQDLGVGALAADARDEVLALRLRLGGDAAAAHDHEVGVHEVVDQFPAGGEEVGLALQCLGPVEPAAEGLETHPHCLLEPAFGDDEDEHKICQVEEKVVQHRAPDALGARVQPALREAEEEQREKRV